MTLGDKQKLFAKLIPRLIDYIYSQGYECTFGDFWAKTGHKENSNHYIRLAGDINLFKDGAYLTDTMAHEPFGKFWESLHPLCRWGGKWKDGNHYEIRND